MGFVMLGMFALNEAGLRGSILQMLNHGVSTGALFLLVGIIYERRHNRMIAEYGGLAKVMPLYAIFFMIITMSSIGLPTLNGFIGEFTILIGAFHHSWVWALFARLGHRPRRRLHAVALPAGLLRRADEREEQGPQGSQPARAVDPDPARSSSPSGSGSIRSPSSTAWRRPWTAFSNGSRWPCPSSRPPRTTWLTSPTSLAPEAAGEHGE